MLYNPCPSYFGICTACPDYQQGSFCSITPFGREIVSFPLFAFIISVLTRVLNPADNSPGVGQVQFNWVDNSIDGNASATDKVMVLVYNPARNEAVYITNGSARSIGNHTLTVPDQYSGDTVYTFIAFISEDGKAVSNSKYVGEVVVASPTP